MAEMITIPYARQQAYRNPQYVAAMADLLMRRGETAAAARMMRGQNTQRLMGDLGQMTMATFAGIGQQRDEERNLAALQAERDRDHALKLAEMKERAEERDAAEKWRRDQFRESRGKEYAAGTNVGVGVSPGDYRRMVEGTASAGRFDYQPAQAERLPARPMADMLGYAGYSDEKGISDWAAPIKRTMSTDTAARPEQYVRTPDAGESLALQNLERQEQALRASTYNTQLDNERAAAAARQAQANADRTYNEQRRQFGITEARLGAAGTGATFGLPPELQGLTGDALLEALPPAQKALFTSLKEYKADINKVFSMRKDQREQAYGIMTLIDPTWDGSQFANRSAVMRDFKAGKAANNIRSLNTAVGHLHDFSDAAAKLQNSDFQRINQFKNWWNKETGDPRISALKTAATAVEGELATVFKGTAGTDQEIAEWRENFNAASSPEQFKSVVQTGLKLIGSRLWALQSQYEQGIGRPKDFNILNNKSREILYQMGINPETMEIQSAPGEAFVPNPQQSVEGGNDFFTRVRQSGQQQVAPFTFGPKTPPPPSATADPFTRPLVTPRRPLFGGGG